MGLIYAIFGLGLAYGAKASVNDTPVLTQRSASKSRDVTLRAVQRDVVTIAFKRA